MKKIKWIITLLSIILLSGCSVNYQVTINSDESVTEEIIATMPNTFYDERKYNSMNYIINSMMTYDYDTINTNEYNYTYYYGDISSGIKLKKRYTNVESFVTDNIAFKEFFKENIYTEKNNIVTITFDKYFTHTDDDIDSYGVNTANISIKTPYKIIESNADRCDNTNTCTWNIKKNLTTKSIVLKYDKGEPITNNYIILYVMCVIIGTILLFISLNLVNKSINRNRI